MLKQHVLPLLILLTLFGCDPNSDNNSAKTQPKNIAPAVTKKLFAEPIEARLVETATAAIPEWRKNRDSAPVLVLLSNNPFLQAIPDLLQGEAEKLILSAAEAEFAQKAVYKSANPVLMPSMAVSGVLQTELFSQVVWVLPLPAPASMPPIDTIRNQLLNAGDISKEEAQSFTAKGDMLSARIRNTPWTICRINSLPEIKKPILLHIDLSFFKSLYKNEISTPLYSIMADIGQQLKEKNWQSVGVTVSASNISGDIALKTRFLGPDIVSLLAQPTILEAEAMPELWYHRSKALYLDNLFQQEKIRDRYLELEKLYPTNASVKYGLFNILGQMKEADKAFQYLSEAVALDEIYALEYLSLAERARKSGRIQAAMDMLNKASTFFPDDPFITLQKIGLYRETGGIGHAKDLIKQLQNLTWSDVYDPDMQEFLDTLATEAATAREKTQKE